MQAGQRVTWPTTVAFVGFVACCRLRLDIAVALVVLGTVWTGLERWRPVHRQPAAFRRTGAATDAAHFVIDEVLAAAGLVAVVFVARPFVDAAVPDAIPRVLHAGPGWTTWLLGLVLAEVFGYWGHRLEHEIPLLWRFHRVHHSSPTMDWLAPNRRHPVDVTFSRVSVTLPMFALGFGLPVVVGAFVIKRFQGLFVHANWDVRLGPLEWVIATPHFHHWHHADHPDAFNTNYAGQSMLVDWVFGTLHRPAGWPERYGCDGYTPDRGYVAQLASPWHPANHPVDPAWVHPATPSSRTARDALDVHRCAAARTLR
jgi:sterol desaturase/sphingolipid hydroxylase (fatty acid hydroxylase superfamily)